MGTASSWLLINLINREHYFSLRAEVLLWTVPYMFQGSALDIEIWKHRWKKINITNNFISFFYLCKEFFAALWLREARQVNSLIDEQVMIQRKGKKITDHWQRRRMCIYVYKLTCMCLCLFTCLYIYANVHNIHTFLFSAYNDPVS